MFEEEVKQFVYHAQRTRELAIKIANKLVDKLRQVIEDLDYDIACHVTGLITIVLRSESRSFQNTIARDIDTEKWVRLDRIIYETYPRLLPVLVCGKERIYVSRDEARKIRRLLRTL